MTRFVAPSLLAADFANLQRDIETINQSEADWLHIDIMDGVFVPNISFGMPVLEGVKKHSKKPLDVHLMIIQPERYIAQFATLGAQNITVHLEACVHVHSVIQKIKEAGCKAGVALNPHTPINTLDCIIGQLDLVCVMSVNPGFGGQRFIDYTFDKVRSLKSLILQSGSKALIEIDGGVNASNARMLFEAGADVLVAGNFVFSSDNPAATISDLKKV